MDSRGHKAGGKLKPLSKEVKTGLKWGLAFSLLVSSGGTWVLVSAFDPSGPNFGDYVDGLGSIGLPLFVLIFFANLVFSRGGKIVR